MQNIWCINKRGSLLLCCYVLFAFFVSGCGLQQGNVSSVLPQAEQNVFKVGMLTDSGSVDDRSFNQGTWEGLVQAGRELHLKIKYLLPAGATVADYDREIANLHDAGFAMIVTPGFKFENSIFTAQSKYPETKFVIIDALPRSPQKEGKTVIAANTVAITFAEQEAGFLAGVAAALQIKTGEFGFIGGMEIPPVQKYNWGFQQGVNYANANYNTKIIMKPQNIVYQGTFSDVAAGQQLAAQLYDKGVVLIFAAAGTVTLGVINEGIARAKTGNNVWVVGTDVDMYSQGLYNKEKTKSVMLTSAMKYINKAAYDMVLSLWQGNFIGGQTLVYDVHNNGVGIPVLNPNLSAEVVKQVNELEEQMKKGEIIVHAQGDGLSK